MRSRVIPGSSPTIERRLPVIRLNRVLLPTFGRPTIATNGSFAAPNFTGTTDLRYVGKTCLQQRNSQRRAALSVYCPVGHRAFRPRFVQKCIAFKRSVDERFLMPTR